MIVNMKTMTETFNIKMNGNLKVITDSCRFEENAKVKYNPFRLFEENVCLDLHTNSGTNAISNLPWQEYLSLRKDIEE